MPCFELFQSSIIRCPHTSRFFTILYNFFLKRVIFNCSNSCQSEIPNLDFVLYQKYIGRLQVAVNNSFRMNIGHTLKHPPDNLYLYIIIFIEFLNDEIFKGHSWTELHHYVQNLKWELMNLRMLFWETSCHNRIGNFHIFFIIMLSIFWSLFYLTLIIEVIITIVLKYDIVSEHNTILLLLPIFVYCLILVLLLMALHILVPYFVKLWDLRGLGNWHISY